MLIWNISDCTEVWEGILQVSVSSLDEHSNLLEEYFLCVSKGNTIARGRGVFFGRSTPNEYYGIIFIPWFTSISVMITNIYNFFVTIHSLSNWR